APTLEQRILAQRVFKLARKPVGTGRMERQLRVLTARLLRIGQGQQKHRHGDTPYRWVPMVSRPPEPRAHRSRVTITLIVTSPGYAQRTRDGSNRRRNREHRGMPSRLRCACADYTSLADD